MKGHSTLVLAACAALLALNASAGTLVFSDNFAGDTLALGVTDASTNNLLPNWNIVAGNVDVIGSDGVNSFYDFYPGMGKYLDLDGTGQPSNAKIQTVASFGPGEYTLTFDLGNNPGGGASQNDLDVYLGTTLIAHLMTSGSPALAHESFTFSSLASGNLSFTQGGPADQQGSILGNVQMMTATPEPGTFAVLGAGLVGLGLLRRRK